MHIFDGTYLVFLARNYSQHMCLHHFAKLNTWQKILQNDVSKKDDEVLFYFTVTMLF